MERLGSKLRKLILQVEDVKVREVLDGMLDLIEESTANDRPSDQPYKQPEPRYTIVG